MNTLHVNKIVKYRNKITYYYSINGEWKSYFSDLRESAIEYSIDISDVPDSICIIPFVGNILPIVWIFDAKIYMNSIDKNFYVHIEEIKKGYKDMYPMLDFKGEIIADCIEDNAVSVEKGYSATFFSGGVDAYTTLFRHMEEKPFLITLWGADIKLEDIQGWNNVWKHTQDVAKEFNLQALSIKSDFRSVIDEEKLSQKVIDSKDGWWHGFQSGIGIITHAASIALGLNIDKVYIASSFSEKVKGKYTCASDPTIDDYIFYANGRTIHDGYELNRQQKIQYIVKRKKEEEKDVKLRVCWESSGGENCCRCEKCYRTILELVSEGEDPNEYGFYWDVQGIRQCKRDLKYKIIRPQFSVDQCYPEIQKRLIQNKSHVQNYKEYKWLEHYDFSKFNNGLIKRLNNSNLMGRFRRLKDKFFHNEQRIKYGGIKIKKKW